MKVPRGFRFGGVHCGLKPQRRDLALIVSDHPASAAGVFTRNKAPAAPIQDARPRLPAEGMRAILANSGNANALTGPAGLDDVSVIRSAVADALGIQKRAVLCASTGVIGARLPAMKVITALPALMEQLGDHADLAAEQDVRDRVDEDALDRAADRPRAEIGRIAGLPAAGAREQVEHRVVDLERDLRLGEARARVGDEQRSDLAILGGPEPLHRHDRAEPADQLGAE